MEAVVVAKEEAKQKQVTELSGSQAVLEALIAEKVDTIFGYPGGAIMPIYDALYDYHEQLKHSFNPVLIDLSLHVQDQENP